MPQALQKLVDLIAELPGIGPRQARRVVQFLLRADTRFKQALADGIMRLADRVSQCRTCFRYDEVNKDGQCTICADASRDRETLLVVEKDVDIDGIEAAGVYKGMYFVLGALMPLARGRKQSVSPRTAQLLSALSGNAVREVILAFATTPEGDLTARELKKHVAEALPSCTVTTLARGLSLGAEIEYADQETLRSALTARRTDF